ncbi:MAG: helix-turn-helix transcriptional regulator [Akkermansiaceae bacterium]
MARLLEIPQLHYRDWLHLSLHLLWSYDDERKLSSDARARKGIRRNKEYTDFKHSSALLVRKGWVEVEHDGQLLRAEPGEWLIVKPTQRTQRLSDDVHLLSVAFEANWPDGRPLIGNGLSCVIFAESCPLLEKQALKIARLMDRIAPDTWNAKDEMTSYQSYLEVQASLAVWMKTLIQTLSEKGIMPALLHGQDERVLCAVRILEAHPLNAPIMLGELAHRVGMSPSYLGSLFKQQIGKTPAAFRNDIKLDYAMRLLSTPDIRSKEVAMDLGFMHLSQFSRWFKSHAMCTPREYIRSQR